MIIITFHRFLFSSFFFLSCELEIQLFLIFFADFFFFFFIVIKQGSFYA